MNGSWLDRNRHVIFIGLLLTTLAGAGIFYWQRPASGPVEIINVNTTPTATSTPVKGPALSNTKEPALSNVEGPTPTPALVRVYVTGAVVKADVYVLSKGSIVKDAVLAAGGFTPDADRERINQALEVKDQQQINVPRQGEENPPPPVQGGTESVPGGGDGNTRSVSLAAPGAKINLNTATLEQLDTLPNIGPALAQRIIEYRDKAGGFKTIEEITQVKGIGEATFAKIKELITIDN